MKLLKKGIALALSLGVSVSAFAEAGSISGYFRVQNAGNSNFVEVTGPFTAKPNISEEDALYSAGTIMYIEAEQNGDSYVLTSLRCQGIDVVGEAISPDKYGEILSGMISTDNISVYGLMRAGFENGYTSIARAAVGTVFSMVAAKLSEDKYNESSYSEADFDALVLNFNETVTATLDLGIRLNPVNVETKTVQVFFDVPSLKPVCDWYAGEYHEMFTAATVAMTKFLSSRYITLETFYKDDVELLESWGYSFPSDLTVASDGSISTTFSTIFANEDLLFNWLKWVGFMILNPDSEYSVAHNIDNLGFSGLANSADNHYLTQMLKSYLPRLHSNTRAYLINGKVVGDDNSVATGATYKWDESADGTLGFANERELSYVAGDNGNWVLVPVDNENGKFMVKLPVSWEDSSTEVANNYAAVYYDFPVTAAEETTVLNTLSSTKMSMGYEYVELEAMTGDVPMQTAIVVQSQENEVQLLVANGTDIVFTPIDESLIGDEVNPEPEEAPENALQITDEEEVSNKQRINRRAAETGNEAFKGVLLPTPYFRIQDYWGFDPSETPVYSNFKNDQVLSSNHLLFENSANDLEANQAIYLYPNTSNNTMMVIIGAPTIEVSVGETDTKEEEPAENIKIAQEFTGNGANSFKGLISLPADLEYGTDFTITMTAPTATGSAAWTVPATPDDLSQSYLDAFLAIQPEPEGFTGSYTPGLYTQYESLFKDQSTVTVDGFYLDNLSATAESTGQDDGKGNYVYNLNFDAPCSGIYQMTITGLGDYAGMTSGPHKIKIYPNLYGTFGADKGFNINGFSFTKIEEATASTGSFAAGDYVIYFPDDYDEAELASAIGYIPGTYFASTLSTNAPAAQDNDTDKSQVRRRAATEYPSAYATTMDVSRYVDNNTPLNVTVEKNGVSATYAFYLAKTTNPNNVSTGVESIEDGANGEAVYYNLQGVKVTNPDKGIYVKVVNGKAEKVIL